MKHLIGLWFCGVSCGGARNDPSSFGFWMGSLTYVHAAVPLSPDLDIAPGGLWQHSGHHHRRNSASCGNSSPRIQLCRDAGLGSVIVENTLTTEAFLPERKSAFSRRLHWSNGHYVADSSTNPIIAKDLETATRQRSHSVRIWMAFAAIDTETTFPISRLSARVCGPSK